MTRILIVHPNRLLREGLAIALTHRSQIIVVGTHTTAHEILGGLKDLNPDVVLIDLCLPSRRGLDDVRLVRDAMPSIKILVTGLSQDEADALTCVEVGARGYLSEEASLDDLCSQIRAVASGMAMCSPQVTALLFSKIENAAREKEIACLNLTSLSRRQLEIVQLLEAKLSNKEIASRLSIEVQTVKNHIHSILEKLGASDRLEAARLARERRLLARPPSGPHPQFR